MKKFYNHLASIYDPLLSTIFKLVKFDEVKYRTKIIQMLLNSQKDVPILDIGCGTGRNLELIKSLLGDRKIYGIDIAGKMLNIAKKRAKKTGIRNIRFIEEDVSNWREIVSFVGNEYYVVSSLTLSVIWENKRAVNGFLSICQHALDYSILDGYWGVGVVPYKGQLTKTFSIPFRINTTYWSQKTGEYILKYLSIKPNVFFKGMLFMA